MKHGLQLLRALDKMDGKAVVLHAGDPPFIVTSTTRWESPIEPLTMPVITTMLADLLPSDRREALDQVGSTSYEMPPMPHMPATTFTVVAGWFGKELWVEIRRAAASSLDLPSDDELWPRGERRPVN